MSNVGRQGQVDDHLPEWDYEFYIQNGQRFYRDKRGTKRTTDDFNPALDLLADNNYDLAIFADRGDWPYDGELLLDGVAGSSFTTFPVIHGRGKGITYLQPKGASIHGIRLAHAVTPWLKDFTLELDAAQIQYHGIYAQDDPAQVGYPETAMFKGVIDSVGITGGKNHTVTPNDYWYMCIETSEFYRIGNIEVHTPVSYRKNGISLRQVDGTLSYAYHDGETFGKNRVSTDGEDVIGLEIANIGSNKEINLMKTTGTWWIRNASGVNSVGVHLKNYQRGRLLNVHTEDFARAIHVETSCYNLEIGGGEGYSYVDTGGTFFDIDSGMDIKLTNWYVACNGAHTLIDNAAGSAGAPVQLELTMQGAVQPTITNSGYLKINRLNTMGTVYPWFYR